MSSTYRTGSLVDALDFPAETLRLVAQYRDALRRDGKSWADSFARSVRSKLENRSFQGLLWSGTGEEAVALAGWEVSGELGRRAWLYLAEGYQRRPVLEGFLRRLEAAGGAALPFISWSDDVPGIAQVDREAVFARHGFSSVVRSDMRFPKGVEPARLPPDPSRLPRRLSLADEVRIADLLFRAYADDPMERALFATTLDQREDARRGTHGLLHGEVGRWIPEASFGIEEGGRLIAHTLANDLEGGLITEVGVDPSFRHQGFARRLLPFTIDALRSAGFEAPRLVVTMRNTRAVELYLKVGFQFEPGGSGRLWLNMPVLRAGSPAP